MSNKSLLLIVDDDSLISDTLSHAFAADFDVVTSHSDPTAPTLPRVTLPELTTPPVTLLPPETSPKVTAPPITLPQATLPSVTLPAPSVPTTLTLPELPQLPILDLGGPGSG